MAVLGGVRLSAEFGDASASDADPTRGNFVPLPYKLVDTELMTRGIWIQHLVTITFLPLDYRLLQDR
jgi:hypothetical protein